MSSYAKVEIEKVPGQGIFTNYDILKGHVTLSVRSPLSLNYIEVKLEGVSRSELSIPRTSSKKRERRREKDKTLQDVHKVLYDTSLVFPPANVRKVSSSKEFTLGSGTYTYPFEFKIPLNNSCVRLQGLSNKITFNKNTFDVVVNNGNFNRNYVMNKGKQLLQNNSEEISIPNDGSSNIQQQYHMNSQLPPTLDGMGTFANVRYYVKVTCKRSSLLKANLRAYDDFVFVPMDLEYGDTNDRNEEYHHREMFFRKNILFRNKIPNIVGVRERTNQEPKKSGGRFFRWFDSRSSDSNAQIDGSFLGVKGTDVPFSIEIRFPRQTLLPRKPPSFRMFLLTTTAPSRYTLTDSGGPKGSNGLGVVYLQRLKAELILRTRVSALENDGSYRELHRSTSERLFKLCDNTYNNLKFDLKDCKRAEFSATQTSGLPQIPFELEIPFKYYANCVLEEPVAPSFTTCNIARDYRLNFQAGFSSEEITNYNSSQEMEEKIRYVDISVPSIKVLSGLGMTRALHDNSSKRNPRDSSPFISHTNSFKNLPSTPSDHKKSEDVPPPLPDHPTLPSYDDVISNGRFQGDAEHSDVRRQYGPG